MKRLIRVLVCLLAATGIGAAYAQEPDGKEILDRVEKLLWGRTVQGSYEMNIATPNWRRTLQLAVWMDRPDRAFIRILAPAKETGIGSLRIKSEMWNYLPSVERIIKIPPSMMLQPWMGSDFTNDDLVKESSIVNDYTHKILDAGGGPDGEALRIEALPKPNAPVIWGRIIYTVRRSDFMPLKQEFFSEKGELIRALGYSDVRPMGGRVIPTRWEMRSALKPGNVTTIIVKDVVYDQPVDGDIFTQRRLRAP